MDWLLFKPALMFGLGLRSVNTVFTWLGVRTPHPAVPSAKFSSGYGVLKLLLNLKMGREWGTRKQIRICKHSQRSNAKLSGVFVIIRCWLLSSTEWPQDRNHKCAADSLKCAADSHGLGREECASCSVKKSGNPPLCCLGVLFVAGCHATQTGFEITM